MVSKLFVWFAFLFIRCKITLNVFFVLFYFTCLAACFYFYSVAEGGGSKRDINCRYLSSILSNLSTILSSTVSILSNLLTRVVVVLALDMLSSELFSVFNTFCSNLCINVRPVVFGPCTGTFNDKLEPEEGGLLVGSVVEGETKLPLLDVSSAFSVTRTTEGASEGLFKDTLP